MSEVERFRQWANAFLEPRRGEWECDYSCWSDLYDAVLELVDSVPFRGWSREEVQAILFAVARDNEMQHLAREIRSRNPETLFALAWAAIEHGEPDAKWQLAEELGQLADVGGDAERLLLVLARDEFEYVRRRSLQSLARLGSHYVEELALEEWQRPDENQQWARMMVLWCLHHVGSPQLAPLLKAAERDDRQYLCDYARRIRRGDVAP